MRISKKIIDAAKQGDPDALYAVWESVKAFAWTVAKRYTPTSYADTDDFMQAAFLGVHAAVMEYAGKYDFLRLAQWKIQNECRTLIGLRSQKSIRDVLSIDSLAPDGENTYADLIEDETIPESNAHMEASDLVRDVRAAVETLPDREHRVITKHYFENTTLDSIAQEDGISKECVRHIQNQAFSRLRKDPVLRTYAPYRRPIMPSLSGSAIRFRRTQTSSTEADALLRIERTQRSSDVKISSFYQQQEQQIQRDVANGRITQALADRLLTRIREIYC